MQLRRRRRAARLSDDQVHVPPITPTPRVDTLTAADLDGDGRANTAGTWSATPATVDLQQSAPLFDDFDNDRKNDFAFLVFENAARTLRLVSGATGAVVFEQELEPDHGVTLVANDLDADGRLDLVVTLTGTPEPPFHYWRSRDDGSVMIYLHRGGWAFQPIRVVENRGLEHSAPATSTATASATAVQPFETEDLLLVYGQGQTFTAPHAVFGVRMDDAADFNGDGITDVYDDRYDTVVLYVGSAAGFVWRGQWALGPSVDGRRIVARLRPGAPPSFVFTSPSITVFEVICTPVRRRGVRS